MLLPNIPNQVNHVKCFVLESLGAFAFQCHVTGTTFVGERRVPSDLRRCRRLDWICCEWRVLPRSSHVVEL